jgi:hypothetical protein
VVGIPHTSNVSTYRKPPYLMVKTIVSG